MTIKNVNVIRAFKKDNIIIKDEFDLARFDNVPWDISNQTKSTKTNYSVPISYNDFK